MAVTLEEVMRSVRNGFTAERLDGAFVLSGGEVLPGGGDLREGDLALIRGSAANDGIHTVAQGLLTETEDEEFIGTMWILRPPADFRRLVSRISAWQEAHPDSGIRAEAFGEYSETRVAGGWPQVFAAELAPWRRMFADAPL